MDIADLKVYARYFIGLSLIIIAMNYFSAVRFALLPISISLLIAIMLIPLDNKLVGVGFSRNISAFISVGVLVGGTFIIGYIFLLPIIKSAQKFAYSFPSLMINIQYRLGITKILNTIGLGDVIMEAINGVMKDFFNISSVMGYMDNILKWLYVIFLIPIFSFYLLRDRHYIQKGLDYIVPTSERLGFNRALKEIYLGLNTYLYGYLFIGVVCFAVSFLCFSIIGLESYLFLSAFMGIFSFIPFIGPFIGGLPAIMVSFGNGLKFWYVVIVIFFIFQFSATILTPKTVGNSVNIHPVFGISAMIFGYGLFGILGILLAVPFIAIIKPIFKYVFSWLTRK